MILRFYHGDLGFESVEVPGGYEAIRDFLEDNRRVDSCDRVLKEVKEVKSFQSPWRMSFNASYVEASSTQVILESTWDDSKVEISRNELIQLMEAWKSFIRSKDRESTYELELLNER